MHLLKLSHFTLLLLTLILSSLVPTITIADSDTDSIVADLLSLQSQSKSGVIRLTDRLLRRILSLPTTSLRPFTFLIFFDAAHLHDKSELNLPSLKSEFSLVASSFISNNRDSSPHLLSTLFFFDLEFKDSQSSFAFFDVNTLPHIRLIDPDVKNPKDAPQIDLRDYSRLAESIAELIETKTKVSIGPINRPPMFSRKQITVCVVIVLICTPYAIKKIIAGGTLLHDYRLWLFGAVFVYFFSVSGAMFNIIRKMPMFIQDRNDPGKLVFFYQGSGMQLGAEGFAVGFLYTIVGLVLALVTHGVIKIRNVNVQRTLMVIALIVSFWAVGKVVHLDNWKTGYGIHGYWPSSWR
ncbi:hypothetical protein Dimus_032910 [Dionaea muscipula]